MPDNSGIGLSGGAWYKPIMNISPPARRFGIDGSRQSKRSLLRGTEGAKVSLIQIVGMISRGVRLRVTVNDTPASRFSSVRGWRLVLISIAYLTTFDGSPAHSCSATARRSAIGIVSRTFSMVFTFVDSARCPKCDTRITTADEGGFLRLSESDTDSSELVVCPHCERAIGAIATATYVIILF